MHWFGWFAPSVRALQIELTIEHAAGRTHAGVEL
jgi:hypothetical protein